MLFRQVFDPDLAQYSYLLACQKSKRALLVDPQRDIDRYLMLAEEEGVEIVAVAETHIHADFLSGARELCARVGAAVYLSGRGGADWQYRWPGTDGYEGHATGQVTLLANGDRFSIGQVELQAIATPGHTPEHLAYLVTDHAGGDPSLIGLLSGDFLLVGDLGRPDLLEIAGNAAHSRQDSARQLYRSLRRLEGLEDHLQVWPAHGAGSSCGKSIGAIPTSTIGFERRHNSALRSATQGEEFFVRRILADQPTPPTYFARMKRTNRDGPPLLRRLPRPRRLSVDELHGVVRHGETLIIDTRPDRQDFIAAHLPGALYAPFGRTFSTAVGAMIVEESRPIVLLSGESGLERLVRDLVRMGYDRVVAFCDESTLEEYLDEGGESAHIPSVVFADLRARLGSSPAAVVDVRDHFEFAEGHIPGAVNAPYTRLPEYLDSRVPADRPLIVHCESGARSAIAAAWLAFCGREVLYVDDDWSAWEAAGGDVESGGGQDSASP
jgi:hydroxyacylglutathione hydrolase